MPDLSRLFNFTNGTTADAEEVDAEFNQILLVLNDLDQENLSSALAAMLGVSQTGVKRRGMARVDGGEVGITSAVYVLGAAPCQVEDVVVPANAAVRIFGRAGITKRAGGGNIHATILANGTSIRSGFGNGNDGNDPVLHAAVGAGQSPTRDYEIGTSPHSSTGLTSYGTSGGGDGAFNSTPPGQLIGGDIVIGLDAGTYDFAWAFRVDDASHEMAIHHRLLAVEVVTF